MATIDGNVAFVATMDYSSNLNQSDSSDMVRNQVRYICTMFSKGIEAEANHTGVEPLVIKRSNISVAQSFCDLVEVHGYFTEDVAMNAVFVLKDSGLLETWSADTAVEFVKNEDGMVTAIQFLRPKIRVLGKNRVPVEDFDR